MSDYQMFVVNMALCKKHAERCKKAIIHSVRLKPLLDDGSLKIIQSEPYYNFRFSLHVNEKEMIVSCSVSPDRMGNRFEYGEISSTKPPSCVEFLIMACPENEDELYEELDYGGDVHSFSWSKSQPDDGFVEVIDEIVRIHEAMVSKLK